MSSENNCKNCNIFGGIGFIEALTLLFIALKLTGNIDWSWFWVLSPILIVVGIIVLFLLLGVLGYLILTLIGYIFDI
ncbi:MAG: hypothetical protein ACOCTT_00750 [archaeon]